MKTWMRMNLCQVAPGMDGPTWGKMDAWMEWQKKMLKNKSNLDEEVSDAAGTEDDELSMDEWHDIELLRW